VIQYKATLGVFALFVIGTALAQNQPTNTTPTSAPSSAPTPPQPVDDATYSAEVKETEEKVSDLKERVFRSKARLLLLKEALVGGAFGSSKAVLIHRSDMGKALRLQRASYSLDNIPIFNKVDVEGSLNKSKQFEIFNQPLAPGPHNLSVYLEYRGEGFGVFDYLNKYTFKIKSSFTFQVEDGKITEVKAIAYEKGGPLVKLEDRPTVRFEATITKATEATEPGETSEKKP
jgi:hypothetical protein